MKKKGFTLIELLAVIVILAVIALIATPVIMNAINEAKRGAAKDSAYSYMSTLEYHIASTYNDDDHTNDFQLNGSLTENQANTLLTNVKVKGSAPTALSDVVLSNGKVSAAKIVVNGYTATVIDGVVTMVVEGAAPATYTITLSGITDAVTLSKTSSVPGEIITITESNDYAIGSITVNGTIITGKTFTMPEQNTTIDITASKIYGVSFNGTTGTRLNKAVGQTYIVNTSTITSSFDTADIYKEIKDVTDTYGNKFVEIPKFYISKSVDANGNFTYKISKYKKDNSYYLPYSFQKEDGTELPYVWIGKYTANLNGTKLESKAGKPSFTGNPIYMFRTYATNNNVGSVQGYQLLDIHAIDIIQALFYVEFATLDSQSIMKGVTSFGAAQSSGTTDLVTTASGSKTSNTTGTYSMKYRGIENIYGNLMQYIDGINIKNYIAYVSTKPSTYQSNIFAGDYKPLGYTNASTSGYVTKMGYDINNPFIQLPISVGTDNYKDYYYTATSNRIALFGGSWDYADKAGISYWYLLDDSETAYADYGSRLVKKPL